MKTYEIHISGRVQGVGFRPFVYNLAEEFGLKGFVSNDEFGVIILVQGDRVPDFYKKISEQKPKSSEIIHSEIKEIPTQEAFDEFFIKPTEQNIVVDIPLTPDFATCSQCEKEMLDPQNHRYFYPFTTCTQCGPRYSVTEKFPFERENTSIAAFTMCPQCHHEYTTPEDVRFHSQTNTCPNCGIQIWLEDREGIRIEGSNKAVFEKLSSELHQGKIVACKNTGGYLLLCDATNSVAISELRKRKRRPTKPFAVLFPEIDEMKRYLEISEIQEEKFHSPESPIVICTIKNPGDLAVNEISPNMDTVGAMYPYSGMLKLLSKTFKKPLIATSANFHGSPICSSTEEARKILKPIADFSVHNTLTIRHPQDDSVIKIAPHSNQPIVFRRSRGFAPNYFFADELSRLNSSKEKILCLGGDLKNTFAAVPNNHVYISEYIGDLANFEVYERLGKTIESYQKIFNFHPEMIVMDKHPRYISRQIIEHFPGIRTVEVQHHQAHFSAILGEKRLWNKEKVLGIIWDGIGFGNNHEIWGGEFFSFENHRIKRFAHLEEFAWILGDKMSVTPKIAALSVSRNDESLKPFFSENEWNLYTKMVEQKEIMTSSVGRLFDAVAFILGYRTPVHFEGEASMWLEKISQQAFDEEIIPENYLENQHFKNIPSFRLIQKILDEKQSGKSSAIIGLNFHYTLIKAIEVISNQYFNLDTKEKNLAFSGGVWQNTLLVDLAFRELSEHFILHFHEKLSPNDENISFGQLNYYLNFKENLNRKQ